MSSLPSPSTHDPQDTCQANDAQAAAAVLRDAPAGSGEASVAQRYQDALLLWLRWNNAYERVTAAIYDSRQDPCEQEELMDQMDQLRQQAVAMSHELLDS